MSEPVKVMEAVNELRETLEKRNQELHDTKQRLVNVETDLEKFEDANQNLVKELNLKKQAEEELNSRVITLEKQISRIGSAGLAKAANEDEVFEAKKAIDALVRSPDMQTFRAKHADLKAWEMSKKSYMGATDDTTGGFLVPPQYMQEILKKIVEISPVRQYSRVTQIAVGNELNVPRRNAILEGSWVAEAKNIPQNQSVYGEVKITTQKLAVVTLISAELLHDSVFNVEQQVADDIILSFAYTEGAAFINGDGVGKPKGLLQNSEVQRLPSGLATDYTADSMIQLTGELKVGYDPVWFLNRREIAKVRRFKDGLGQYIWTPGLANGVPSMIDGRPYVSVINMPDAGAGTTPVLFGDVKSAYMILDSLRLTMLRDPYSNSGSDLIKIVATRRVGADVVMPEAIKLLQCSVS